MMQPLQLRYRPGHRTRPEGRQPEAPNPAPFPAPDAWFLPGHETDRWLEELARCGLAGADTRLYAVARRSGPPGCAGILVVPGRGASSGSPSSGVPCRLIAGRWFLPADAVLHPPLTDSELRDLCPLHVCFYHPAFGLSGFEEGSALSVGDLVRPPAERSGRWNCARPGAPAHPDLTSVVLLQPPSFGDVFGEAQKEIGNEADADLPPAPDEPKNDPLTGGLRRLERFFFEGVAAVTRQVPHTGPTRTWWNGLEDWAHRRLQGLNGQLERLRNKEIHRLLHLLDSDPESGLRHAIPMNRFAHRGIAPPGARLVSRPLDFDPNRLGGQAADFWHVPAALQEILLRRYREMADREMRLGRPRRAAYIYAQLLGDLASAARALHQGGLFREAALLYEERLNSPLAAAACLADGGFLEEAIRAYEKLGRWIEVADLQDRAGNPAAAREALERVVRERLGQDDTLGAAALVEERLRQPDRALEMLLGAWPASRQAANALAAAFKILARLGRHAAALERLAELQRGRVPESLLAPSLSMLEGVARDYPHAGVRHRAADLSRVLVARGLSRPDLSGGQAMRLAERLARLAPRDRLLSRDARRFVAARRNAELRAFRLKPPIAPDSKPVLVRRFDLPRQIRWVSLRREAHWFYALGVTPGQLTLVRGIWDGEFQSMSWNCPAEMLSMDVTMEPTNEQGRAVTLTWPGHPPLAQKSFPPAGEFFGTACVVGALPWLPATEFPIAFGEGVVWLIRAANSRAVLAGHDKGAGNLRRTRDITAELLAGAERDGNSRVLLVALRTGAAVALGNRLVVTSVEGGFKQVALPGHATGLVATIPNTRPGLAVMLRNGAVFHWVGGDGILELDSSMAAPMGAFVPGGPLVLISGRQALLLDVESRGARTVARMELTGPPPVGVCATGSQGEFAVLGPGGQMDLYRTPGDPAGAGLPWGASIPY